MDTKIVLVGYMASGKSTIGKYLAEELDIEFMDLDDAISTKVGLTIPEIFETKGELFFRKIETKVLNELLVENKGLVIATGGGTPCYGNNMKDIDVQTKNTFYLKLSIPSLLERIRKEKEQRPLVTQLDDKDLPEFIGKHLFERSMFYAMAKHTIECDNKSVEEISGKIREFLV
ncbi:shikimate kinase [Croceitalea sp. MTPC9]|uniref:shikimate kinase n=1 Tax=unclassified Croceitalea TaxID=2632280 RepID=UPI002B3FAEED|nr:shikimate kinase [Croceitalea sp. MTPC6]GMN18014.1 shikimate kinase [Croceitalea sp. MTPC9]